MTRRRAFLGMLSGVSVSLAGCLGGSDEPDVDRGEQPTADETDDDEPVIPNTEVYDFPPADEPAEEAPDDMFCGVCNMRPANFPEANTQAVHDDSHRQFLCSPGCLIAYYTQPAEFADTDAQLEHAWARDADSKSLYPIDEFYWVLEDPDDGWEPDENGRGLDPMDNPLPYVNREDAASYTEQWDDLSETDIVTTDELSEEDAKTYRSQYV